jgi:hypothetical protein
VKLRELTPEMEAMIVRGPLGEVEVDEAHFPGEIIPDARRMAGALTDRDWDSEMGDEERIEWCLRVMWLVVHLDDDQPADFEEGLAELGFVSAVVSRILLTEFGEEIHPGAAMRMAALAVRDIRDEVGEAQAEMRKRRMN